MRLTFTMRFALRLLAVALLAGLTTPFAFADTASLVYDPAGNVASRTTAQGTTTYTYDAADRLIAESGPAGNFNYSYDANSVRLSDSGGSYTYSTTSNRLTARHGRAVITDAAGNITSDGLGHTYAYNQAGRMSEARLNGVLLASYDYDYRGLRNRKVTTATAPQGAQTILYVYDEAGHLLEELTATGAAIRTYVWRDDTPLAQIEHIPARRVIYFEVDHLNTPRVARDQSGVVVWTWVSDAFGAIQPNQNPSGAGVVTVNLRFPGQYYDQETGLFYNGQRYYDPGMGQYTQPDLIGLAGGSFSTYTYAGGNPLRWSDPNGECPWCLPALGAAATFNGLMHLLNSAYNFYADLSSQATSQKALSLARSACDSYPAGGACGDLPNLQQQANQCTANSIKAGANIPGTLTSPKFPATTMPK
ncbi:RHS repeat-associated core domain-containing protein [Sideroxydans sp. CL21]|uniref:RHS repeat-associated core domain-containing protein n=1 Tax=Sideroxydans sp. CL21 TaxID=2600596 RepID=UPI0024BC00FD|nr:RHS repeat-associated core domain-containing protein [Sideroxydans sp. CL21]